MEKRFTTYLEVAEEFWYTNDLTPFKQSDAKKEEYNKESVTWCAVCKSLHIVNVDSPLDQGLQCYCADCGCITTEEGHIDDWLKIGFKISLK